MKEDDKERLDRFLERADAILSGAEDADSAPPEAGMRIGGYRLLRRIGHGGMGVVWLAQDETLKREVALKLLAPHMTVDPEAIWRFGQEASAAARLMHANIVTIHAAGEEAETRYLVMDYVKGVGLDRVVDLLRGRKPEAVTRSEVLGVVAAETGAEPPPAGHEDYVRLAVEWVVQAAEAVHHAHSRGVLHRDIKPSNLLLDDKGEVRVVDFGLARIEESAPVTRTGAILGTLTYMAPEALAGEPGRVDARADVYSLGTVLFELLAFRPPFVSSSLTDLIEEVNRGEMPRLRRLHPGLPRDLELVVSKCLAKEREHRYATALDLAEDLKRFLAGETVSARPAGPLRRMRYLVRRHPGRSAAATVMLLALIGIWPALGLAARIRAAADAQAERDLARRNISRYWEIRSELEDARERLGQHLTVVSRHVYDSERNASVVAFENRIQTLELELARGLEEARSALDRAARIEEAHGGVSAETDRAFAEYNLFRYERALELDKVVEQALFREAVLRHDRSGEFAPLLEGRASLEISVSPRDADLFLFRYESYETLRTTRPVVPRLVPVPTTGRGRCRSGPWSPDFFPGDPCLVVTRVSPGSPAERAGVSPGDLVLRINGARCGDGAFVSDVEPDGVARREGVRRWDRASLADGKNVRGTFEWRKCILEAPPADHEVRIGQTRFQVLRSERIGVRVASASSVLRTPAPRGGGRLHLLQNGKPSQLDVQADVPPGLECEVACYPLIFSAENRVDAFRPIAVSPGSYLLCARRAGFEDLRFPVLVGRSEDAKAQLTLLPQGSTPSGAVWVPPGPCIIEGDPEIHRSGPVNDPRSRTVVDIDGFFIRRTEVTMKEWFEYINDAETLEYIRTLRTEKGWTTLLPRHYNFTEPLAIQQEDGRWIPNYPLEAPVLGISRKDIEQFLLWYNARARKRKDRWLWRLPSAWEWEKAARGVDGRLYPWGNRFDCDLCLSSGARDGWLADQPSRFEPRDESPFGVFDLAGSRREWAANTLKGGSWGDGTVHYFRASWGEGLGPGYYNWTTGFRPVLYRDPDAR